MRTSVKTLIWYLTTHIELTGPIADLGSRQSPNQLVSSDLRPLFRGKTYIGCDSVLGCGVDRVENIEQLCFEDASLWTVLCLDTLEHVADPLQAMKEIVRVIADNGILIVTSHMYAPVHYNPDYWRFSPQCFHDVLLKDFPGKIVMLAGEANFPELIVGIATKVDSLPFEIDFPELNSMLPWSYPFPLYPWKGENP